MLVSLLRENNQRERYFSPDEIRRLFHAADVDENFYAGQYIKMLLLTGLRRAELARAKWQHYNREDKTLYIPHTKNGHSRILHLNHMAVDLLNYLPVRPGNPYLFPGHRKGKPLQNPTKGFQKMLARAGIDKEGVCLHTCRHSVAALIVSNGGTLFDVQSQLGCQIIELLSFVFHRSQPTYVGSFGKKAVNRLSFYSINWVYNRVNLITTNRSQ